MIDPHFRYEKKTTQVNGYKMAYAEAGDAEGDPIIFLHGNATSSYMWRNIMPHVEDLGRLIAIDNIGQGDSDKLKNSDATSYSLGQHQDFIDGTLAALGVTLAALGVTDNVTFVMHDWGGPIGLNWARRHPGKIKGLAHSEIVVCNHPSWDEYPEAIGKLLQTLRGPEGEKLVLEDNFFVEKVFTGGVMRDIDEATMTEMRRPYVEPGEARRATLSWVRQIPVEGMPEAVAKMVDENAAWMAAHDIPKLFIRADPGQIIFQRDLDIIRAWPNQTEAVVKGLHHPQEDSPDDIGAALADWLQEIG
ncbi:MAG: haloalkane dehalogenase [Rhodospirillaceae bacterium]|nr:haloalkane dehalogenase [Rhodospirillaceae bacterium]